MPSAPPRLTARSARLLPCLAMMLVGGLMASPGWAQAPASDEIETLRERIRTLRATVAKLEAQNARLRAQWGQATLENNRLRDKLERLRQVAPAEPEPEPAPAPADAAPADDGRPAASSAGAPPAEPTDAAVERLRDENEDLRLRNRELTALAGLAPNDERVATQAARIAATFDEAANRTVVRTEQVKLSVTAGSRADHFLSLAYSFAGRSPDGPADQVTMFIQAVYSGGAYSKDRPLTLRIDGEPVTLPVAGYDATRRSTSLAGRRRLRRDDETVTFVLDAELLRRLARAVSVTGAMGATSFELTRDQIALFTAMKKRSESARGAGH